MSLRNFLSKLVPLRSQKPNTNDPLSIVLLLRCPHSFGPDDVRVAAERAWGVRFVGDAGSGNFVKQTGFRLLIKAGPHLLVLFSVPKPYFGRDPRENLEWLPQGSQRKAWAEHTAWAAVDYMNRKLDAEVAYCVLSKLVAEMLDQNCTGIYIPRERSLIPNDESLYRELQKLASSRDSGVDAPLSPG